MFKSKRRDIITPQYEHGLFAGVLAGNWGNEMFDRPVFDFDLFVEGVTFHDWQYRMLDTTPIGAVEDAPWLAVMRRCLDDEFGNPIVDVVAKLHVRRLVAADNNPESITLVDEIDRYVTSRVKETKHAIDDFLWADRITAACDWISFVCCFEEDAQFSVDVCRQSNSTSSTTLEIEINGGQVSIDPWPFTVNRINTVVTAFQNQGYPEKLVPCAYQISISAKRQL